VSQGTSIALCGTIPGYQDNRIKALLLFSTGAGKTAYDRVLQQRDPMLTMYIVEK